MDELPATDRADPPWLTAALARLPGPDTPAGHRVELSVSSVMAPHLAGREPAPP